MLRIGIGYDVHRLIKRRKLILGGVNIPFTKGLFGHSDADVLLHAICDALLGACGKKDIGAHFPNNHSAYKDISSIKLLKRVNLVVKRLGYSVVNIDTIITAEKPNLSRFRNKMCKKIIQELGLSSGQVNVKATTAEGTGPVGRGEVISAYAVALIEKSN
jgi:2-C-methyl-D-erythritol 2,4-cyclodiphosphate synthase